jgi:hypothetical protein
MYPCNESSRKLHVMTNAAVYIPLSPGCDALRVRVFRVVL